MLKDALGGKVVTFGSAKRDESECIDFVWRVCNERWTEGTLFVKTDAEEST